jgi:hypothetical protein
MTSFAEEPARLFFVHINKTGGSSIERALNLRFKHKTALEIIAKVGRPQWDQAYTFAAIRNPWDRVVSHYHYRAQTNQTNLGTDAISFAEWVQLTYGSQDPRYYDIPMAFMPQINWITDREGQLLVKFICRFERLDADFKNVCAHLNRVAAPLPRLKASSHGPYRDYYDSATAKIVADWFHKDIQSFGYQF